MNHFPKKIEKVDQSSRDTFRKKFFNAIKLSLKNPMGESLRQKVAAMATEGFTLGHLTKEELQEYC